MVIQNDGKDTPADTMAPAPSEDLENPEKIATLIREAGIVGMVTSRSHESVIREVEAMSEQQLQARLEALKSLKIHPREREENRLLLARAERLYEELRGEDRERVMDAMISFKRALETQDEKTATQAAQVFGPFLDRFECEV